MMYFFAVVDNKGFVFMTGTGTKSCAREHKERVFKSLKATLHLKIKYFNGLDERTAFILERREALIKGGK